MNAALLVLAMSIIAVASVGVTQQARESTGRSVSPVTQSYLSDKRACEAIGGRWLRMMTNRRYWTPVCIDRKALFMSPQ